MRVARLAEDHCSAQARAFSPICRAWPGSFSTEQTAAAKSSSDSSTTQAPLPEVSTERVPRQAVDTTGRDCAMASSSTSPWVSVREANTNASAAA